MEKIVIVTRQPGPNKELLTLLHTLFPDCEVGFVFKDGETFMQYQTDSASGLLTSETTGRDQ